jgi:peptide chain release factor
MCICLGHCTSNLIAPQNKTSSAVQLKHLPTGIVVKSQETRSRQQNRKIARRILSDKLELLEKGEDSRVAIKAKEKSRKKASSTKKSRRKYRKLDEIKEMAAEAGSMDEEYEEGRGLMESQIGSTSQAEKDS